MPIPFGKAFSYGTFLQYLRSLGPNALPCRPTVSRGHLQLSKDKPCNDALYIFIRLYVINCRICWLNINRSLV